MSFSLSPTLSLQLNVFFLFVLCFTSHQHQAEAGTVTYDVNGFIIDNKYRTLRGGTIQWFRISPSTWSDRLQQFKAAGFNTIDMYVAWNYHERVEGVFDWETYNITAFLDLAQSYNLFVYLRPGPYITDEINGGGLPSWLLVNSTKTSIASDGRPNLRTEDPDYLSACARYLHALNNVVKPYLHTRAANGPIIMMAIENEFDWFTDFFLVDEGFLLNGGFERPIGQSSNVTLYFQSLRDMLLMDGIDVPITTCPGAGVVQATGNVAGVIPIPNIYGAGTDEQRAINILTSMHSTQQFNGAYVNMPSGATETTRDPMRLKRFMLAGMDAFFAFNIMSMSQDGYNNAMVMSNDLKSVLHLDVQAFISGLAVSPTIGYFHSVLDYNGMVSANGVVRDLFACFRRVNLLLDDLEPALASSLVATRSSVNNRNGLQISVTNVGINEGDSARTYYFMTLHNIPLSPLSQGQNATILELVNEIGTPVLLPPNSITFNSLTFPLYTTLTLPIFINTDQNPITTTIVSTAFAGLYLLYFPLTDLSALYNSTTAVAAVESAAFVMQYSTSEVLTSRGVWGGHRLLILYGAEGTQGELSILTKNQSSIVASSLSVSIQRHGSADGVWHFSYTHSAASASVIVLQTMSTTLTVLVVETYIAGRTYFVDSDTGAISVSSGGASGLSTSTQQMIILGTDYFNASTVQLGVDAKTGLKTISFSSTHNASASESGTGTTIGSSVPNLLVITPFPMLLNHSWWSQTSSPISPLGSVNITRSVSNAPSSIFFMTFSFTGPPLTLPALPNIASGVSFSDTKEGFFSYSTSSSSSPSPSPSSSSSASSLFNNYSSTDGWISWTGSEPKSLEEIGVYGGHVWIHIEFDVPVSTLPSNPTSTTGSLYISRASDFIGIYVNGHYVTTLAPVGTEVNSASSSSRYAFESIVPYLMPGKNVIAIRNEVWGHGSFMFPRGTVVALTARIPSIGMDSLKGVFSEGVNQVYIDTSISKIYPTAYHVRPQLTGEIAGYNENLYNDAQWSPTSIPFTMTSGDVQWYRVHIPASSIPSTIVPSSTTTTTTTTMYDAPFALMLQGVNVKATIFLNGKLIGRWLSDTNFLNRGTWTTSSRTLFNSASPDFFPLPFQLLHTITSDDRADNVLSIAFEDVSVYATMQAPGIVTNLSLVYNQDIKTFSANGMAYTFAPGVRYQNTLTLMTTTQASSSASSASSTSPSLSNTLLIIIIIVSVVVVLLVVAVVVIVCMRQRKARLTANKTNFKISEMSAA